MTFRWEWEWLHLKALAVKRVKCEGVTTGWNFDTFSGKVWLWALNKCEYVSFRTEEDLSCQKRVSITFWASSYTLKKQSVSFLYSLTGIINCGALHHFHFTCVDECEKAKVLLGSYLTPPVQTAQKPNRFSCRYVALEMYMWHGRQYWRSSEYDMCVSSSCTLGPH